MAKNPVNPKLKLFADDPLTKALKREHWDEINPFTYTISSDPLSSLPQIEYTFSDIVADGDDSSAAPGDPLYLGVQKLEAPNLEDITVIKAELYYDQKKVPKMRFVFNVKNHVGEGVVGVKGKGG